MSIAVFEQVSPARYAADSAAYAQVMPLEELPLPRRATAGSAGYDFVCPVEVTLRPGEMAAIPTGIRAVMDAAWVLVICPRSSLGRKFGLRLANTIGVIDSDYAHADNEGHILVMLVNGGGEACTLHPGDRFCQGIFLPYGLAKEAPVHADRVGGYGSTGA